MEKIISKNFSEYLNERKSVDYLIYEYGDNLADADWLIEDDFDTWDEINQQAKKLKMKEAYIISTLNASESEMKEIEKHIKGKKIKMFKNNLMWRMHAIVFDFDEYNEILANK